MVASANPNENLFPKYIGGACAAVAVLRSVRDEHDSDDDSDGDEDESDSA